MKNWPYSVDSFTNLSINKARQGDDPTQVEPIVATCFQDLAKLRKDYLAQRRVMRQDPKAWTSATEIYTKRREVLRKHRDNVVGNAIGSARNEFERNLDAGTFRWNLSPGPQFKKKGRAGEVRRTYVIPQGLHWRLPALQASAIIRDGANLTTLSRNSLVRALQHALQRPYAHGIIKIDISKYFESISHTLLLEKLSTLRTVDSTTIRLVEILLEEYREISGAERGVPQGVGMSAPLAELYLADFDRHLRTLPGVVYYARYVDDVVIVLDSHESVTYAEGALDSLLERLELERNPDKNRRIITTDNGSHPLAQSLDYLGYRFRLESKKLQTTLTENRVELRKRRLARAFEAWNKRNPDPAKPNHGLDGLLIKRVEFLAGNARLSHSKSNVVVGIYFSNSALGSDALQLREFDTTLHELTNNFAGKMNSALLERLSKLSFVEGFQKRTFVRLSQKEVERVVACWKDLS